MWSNFISCIRDEHNDDFTKTSLVVVDSDLGNIGNYNERKQKFYSGLILPCEDAVVMLPENFTMCYARADTSSSSALNVMIKCCEYMASELLSDLRRPDFTSKDKYIQRVEVLDKFKSMSENVYSKLRQFFENNSK